MPRHFLSTSNESGLKQIEGRIVDGIAHVKTTLNGEITESEIPVPSDTVSEYTGVASLLTQKELKIGDRRTFHIFMFDLLKPVKTEIEILGEETLTYQSEEKQVYVLKQTMDMMNGITAKLWIDTDGVNYRTEVPLMGLSMVTTKTDKETALGGIEEVDVVLNTRILPSGKHPISKAKHLEAEVKLPTGNIAEVVMSTPRQKLEVSYNGIGGTTPSYKLSIQVPVIVAEDCLALPIQNSEGEFLAASAYIQADHPDIQAKAAEILENEVNSWRAAEKLCRWVYASINDKKMSGGFASSLTVLQSLSGDCTEHTVLFIALARAVGIPARICSGIVLPRMPSIIISGPKSTLVNGYKWIQRWIRSLLMQTTFNSTEAPWSRTILWNSQKVSFIPSTNLKLPSISDQLSGRFFLRKTFRLSEGIVISSQHGFFLRKNLSVLRQLRGYGICILFN